MKKFFAIISFVALSINFSFAQWTQVGSDLDAEMAGDRAGRSVSISASGSVIAVGAIFNDGAGTDAGHVRVYESNAGVWSQLGSDIDGEAAGDAFG